MRVSRRQEDIKTNSLVPTGPDRRDKTIDTNVRMMETRQITVTTYTDLLMFPILQLTTEYEPGLISECKQSPCVHFILIF